LAAFEVFVLKVHAIFLFGNAGHLAKLVHVELPNEGRDVLVPKIVRQDFVFQFFTAFY
jgi:hypothetical protein